MCLRPAKGIKLKGDYQIVTVIKRRPEELSSNSEFYWEEFPDDLLGRISATAFQVPNDEYIILNYWPSPYNWNDLNQMEMLTLHQSPNASETVELALIGLGLTSKDINGLLPHIKLRRHEVIRQDDYGNQSSLGIYPCRADATKVVEEFTAHGHKQGYWLREVPDEPKVYHLPKML